MPMELLHLLQLADSALPVGGMAHSFGLESLVEFGFLQPESLECFLREWLSEAGLLEAAFCARACAFPEEFGALNMRLCARKPARESREGSAAMGRRLLDLAVRAYGMTPVPLPHGRGSEELLQSRDREEAVANTEVQYPCCFGYVSALLGVPQNLAVGAFLHQSVAALISACQRLMPLGHTHAQAILYRLKPQIAAVAAHAVTAGIDVPSFTPLLETASMCHARLATRLFIS